MVGNADECTNGLTFRATTQGRPYKCIGLVSAKIGAETTGFAPYPVGERLGAPVTNPSALASHDAETTGLYVQMGLFPGDHAGSPLQMYRARFGKNRCRDYGVAPYPVGERLGAPVTNPSALASHGAETTGAHRESLRRTARRPFGKNFTFLFKKMKINLAYDVRMC